MSYIHGKVIDNATGQALVGATVQCATLSVRTVGSCIYCAFGEPGSHTLTAQHNGAAKNVPVTMTAVPQKVDISLP